MRRLASLLFTLAVSAAPAVAQPYETYDHGDVDASIYADVNVTFNGSEVPDISLFFDRLAPYGTWYDDAVYGYVFAPADPYYTPYSNGFWKYTQFGWTWISNDAFGWATDHYGRWVWRNRWVWKPDTQWGPAWVQWREGDNGYIGWAPLGYDVNAYIPETHWRFIPTIYITSQDLPRYYVRRDLSRYVRDTRPVVRWNRYGNHRWVAGPDRDYLDRHRVRVQRDDRYNLRQIGRLDARERREAEQRATQARVRYRDRLQREAQVRSDLDRKRVEVERRQVEQQRQRVRTQPRVDRNEQRQQQDRQRQERERQQIQQQQREQREGVQRQRELDQRVKAQRDEQARKQQIEQQQREQAQRQTQQRQRDEAARRQVEQRQQQQRQQEERQRQQQHQQDQRREQQQRQVEQRRQNEARQVEQRKQQNEARQQQQRQQVEQRKQQNEARQQQQRQQVEQRKQQAQQRQQQQRQQVEERREQKQKQDSRERREPRSQNDKRDKR